MTAKLPPLKVGDRVLRVYRGREPEEVEVVRVGRKWVYLRLNSWQDTAYSIETGYVKSGPGFTDRIATREMLDIERRYHDALERIRKAGFQAQFSARVERQVSISTLEEIADLLEADQ